MSDKVQELLSEREANLQSAKHNNHIYQNRSDAGVKELLASKETGTEGLTHNHSHTHNALEDAGVKELLASRESGAQALKHNNNIYQNRSDAAAKESA